MGKKLFMLIMLLCLGITNGTLDSLAKIKAIDEVLGTDLKLYIK